jgi:ligand-binding SRPBCC domain-containing protein
MKFTVSTAVALPPRRAIEKFDATLFNALSPPFPKARLLKFDPETVEIELDFFIAKTRWESKVYPSVVNDAEAYFVDEGVRLPPPLKRWRHVHRLVARPDGGSDLRDEIEFSTSHPVVDLLALPFLWAMMVYRKPIYRRRLR